MDKTRKLENRWLKYKIQKVILSIAVVLALFLVALLSYFYVFEKDLLYDFLGEERVIETPLSQNMADFNNSISFIDESNLSAVPPLIIEEEEVRVEVKEEFFIEETLSLEPIIPIIDMEKERHTHVRSTAKRASVSKTVRAKPANYLTSSELKNVGTSRDTTKLKKIHLTSSSKNYVETMKLKFLKNKNPRDALLLAKVFYKRGAYNESEKWALTANKLDYKQADSWIVFAKSKAKMGQKDEAIKILYTYYKKSKSAKVKAVIEKIKTGEF
jgi:tetratricopeptide (TPR) repeat protein